MVNFKRTINIFAVAILFLIVAPVSSTAKASSQSCVQIMKAPDDAVLAKRMSVVINHQNAQRALRKLPALSQKFVSTLPNLLTADPVGAFPDYPIAGIFNIQHGNTIIRSVQNDLFSLNYVYEFDGERLQRIIPYGAWLLNHTSTSVIRLYRQMSAAELALWKARDFSRIGSDWGHGMPVVHFTTNRRFTSAAGSSADPLIEIRVEKAFLQKLALDQLIWAANLSEEPRADEFVWPADLLRKALSEGSVQINQP